MNSLRRNLSSIFSGDNNGNRIHYRCDAVKKLAEHHLITLGAISIQLKCSGGLEDYVRTPYWTPLTLTAQFEAPVVQRGGYRNRQLTLNSDRLMQEDCFLNVALLNKALPLFSAISVMKKNDACMHNYTRWSYTVKIAE